MSSESFSPTQLRGIDKTLWDRLTEESGTPEETAEVVVKLGLASQVGSSSKLSEVFWSSSFVPTWPRHLKHDSPNRQS